MKTDKINLKKGCIIFVIAYFILAGIFYVVAGEQLYYRDSVGKNVALEGDIATAEITKDFKISQKFRVSMDRVEGFTVKLATFARENTGKIEIKLKDYDTKKVIIEQTLDVSKLEDSAFTTIMVNGKLDGYRNKDLLIEITADSAKAGNAVAPWYNSQTQIENSQLYFNGEPTNGTLCFDTLGKDLVWTGPHYWQFIIGAGIVIMLYFASIVYKQKKGKKSIVLNSIIALKNYKFLIKQLVARDFKVKYKRSVLGAFWSFLNPLLTMLVQYVVFSTIFKSDIENYPVYLLSGIVLFGFFQESTNTSLMAILGNSNLITKVYVPKYIYPVTRVLSSTVNLVISLAPLLIMVLITRVQITKAFVLIPFALIFLVVYCIGMGFILSSAIVFFRDVQFIWSVFSLLWMYATPIFYPESILPANFSIVLKINPLYYFIKFFRTIILEGISPEPMLYVQCAVFSIVTLIFGAFIFKKSQDKFILYI